MAATGLLRAKATANEATAIASVRATSSGQKAYAIACGAGAYASSYLILGASPPAGGPGFISADLGLAVTPQKAGFRYVITAGAGSIAGPNDCNGVATITAYYATAMPLSFISGSRSFAINGNGVVWQLRGGTAPAEPFGAPATPIQQ